VPTSLEFVLNYSSKAKDWGGHNAQEKKSTWAQIGGSRGEHACEAELELLRAKRALGSLGLCAQLEGSQIV